MLDGIGARPSSKDSVSSATRSLTAGLVLIFLIGIGVRVAFLFQPMRSDESLTYSDYASRSLGVVVTDYSQPNNHVLHTVLVYLSTSLLGSAPWAIRLPALLAGIAIIPVTYLSARAFYNERVALVSAAIVATSSPLVLYSTNARGYTLLILLTLCLLLLANEIRASNKTGTWVLFSVVASLGFYTIPIMLYPYGGIVIWLLLIVLFSDDRSSAAVFLRNLSLSVFCTILLTLILYLPIVEMFGFQAIVGNTYVQRETGFAFLRSATQLWSEIWGQWHDDYQLPVSILLTVLAILGFTFRHRTSSTKGSPFTTMVVWCVVYLIASQAVPFLRVLLFLIPIGAIWIGCGLFLLLQKAPYLRDDQRSVVTTILAVLFALITAGSLLVQQTPYYADATGTLRDASTIAQQLQKDLRGDDEVIVQTPSYEPLRYYFSRLNVPLRHLCAWMLCKPSISTRLFIVVNIRENQTINGVLQSASINKQHYNAPRLLYKRLFANVYVTQPLHAGHRN